jgi:hypothetical protein
MRLHAQKCQCAAKDQFTLTFPMVCMCTRASACECANGRACTCRQLQVRVLGVAHVKDVSSKSLSALKICTRLFSCEHNKR